MIIAPNSTSQSLYVYITNQLGVAATGLLYNSPGATAAFTRQGAASTAITLASLASAGAPYSSGGFVEVHATRHPGLYRLDVPDAAFVIGANQAYVSVSFTGYVCSPLIVDLVAPGGITDANTLADAILKRDLTAVTGAPLLSPYTMAMWVVGKTIILGSKLIVYKADETTKLAEQNLTFDTYGRVAGHSKMNTPT